MNGKAAVVLVNYHDYANKYLTACRDCLRFQTYPTDKLKIYIIDNDSTPASFNYLKNTYPEAQILTRADGNYCAANNLGFKEGLKDGCEYLVTLNMDTELDAHCLSELILALEKNKEAGIAQAKILLYPKNDNEKSQVKINTLGNKVNFLGFGTTSHYNELDYEIEGYSEIKGYASGCCFVVRNEVFQKISGWNEEYFMYHDDIEFGLKTRLAGYKIILAPRARVFHKYEFTRSIKMLYYMERNRYLLALSFYPFKMLILLKPVFLFMAIGLMFYSIFKGWFLTWLKSIVYFYKPSTWRKIKMYRQEIRKINSQPLAILKENISSRIDFLEIDNPILRLIVNPLLSLYWRLVKIVL